MRIMGIDPGLGVCGYAVLDRNRLADKIIEAGIIETDKSLPIEKRLNQIATDIENIIGKFKPDIVAIEKLYSHYAHPKTAILMGHARGVIMQKCAETNTAVKSYSATMIKKSITGNGKASKQQIQRTIQTLLSLPRIPEPDDVADAMAVAICCADHCSREIPETVLKSSC